jgi:peptidyl-prolyl cis-trans isomerase C
MTSTFKHLVIAAAIATTATATYAQTAASVNGKPISSATVDFVIKQQEKAQTQGKAVNVTPEQRKILIERMIDMEVLAQDATKQGLGGKDLEIELSLMKTQMLVRAAIKTFQEKHPVSDTDAKAEYDKEIKKLTPDNKEYKARHILLDDEAKAKDFIVKLKAGAKFEDLAKDSKDEGSAAQGGDLGFAAPNTYVKPFADALAAMKKGDLTPTPIKTEFGFHIIELTDVRDAVPPSFEEVKAQIKEGLLAKKIEAYQQGLRKAAVIK